MKLLIEIPDKLYNFVRSKTSAGNTRNFDEYDMYDVSRCIANGTPLPEHHRDLNEVANIRCRDCKHHSEDGCYVCYYELATKEGDGE